MLYNACRLVYLALAACLAYLAWTLVCSALNGTADASMTHGATLACADALAFILAAGLVAYQTVTHPVR